MIKLPAYFSGFNSKADGSAGLRFSTQELTPDDFAEFQRNRNAFGWLLFKDSEIRVDDLPDEDVVEDGEKKPSKRLRNVLFVYWKKNTDEGKLTVSFKIFYDNYMEKLIENVKAKLD